ncbi:NAD(P)H-dependent oxidoreductase [Kineococcus sp. LSe6-4]|uniref:NAD(P)H-dependent oxidoreductase n=1 Tax=Kineococcus halophytocola TaxID=3234027 RepID=A0ABV4GWP2_9ACTN
MTDVLVLVGSLRAASTNRQIAETAVALAPEGVTLTIHEGLADLPFYNEDVDVEGSVPQAVTDLRAALTAADAVLVVTPEHNGTVPAVLKNAIDWASRPYGAGSLNGTPLVVVGSAFGQYGGVWAQDDARKALGIAGANVLSDVTFAIPGSVVRFAELHPKDDAEVVEKLTAVLEGLVAATRAA